jgi:hypothetical protein
MRAVLWREEELAIEHSRWRDMSGRGHRIFIDELECFAAEVAEMRCAAIAARLTAPLRVAVSGCRAVGWQRDGRGLVAGMHRACNADIVRGSWRLWSKVRRSA